MIPNTKISETILEFGKYVILELPSGYSKDEFETAITIIITTWNAVVMDAWGKDNRYESQLLSTMKAAPKEIQIEIRRLIKRKKNEFGSDPRAVGNHWIREQDGELVFGCDARLHVENTLPSDTTH